MKNLYQHIVACHGVFPQAEISAPFGGEFRVFPFWRMPIMSPFFIPKEKVKQKNLRVLEKYFSRFKKQERMDARKPYANILTKTKISQKFLDDNVLPSGWGLVERDSRICILNKVRKISLAPGYSFRVAESSSPKSLKIDRQVCFEGFGIKPNSILRKEIEKAMKILVGHIVFIENS